MKLSISNHFQSVKAADLFCVIQSGIEKIWKAWRILYKMEKYYP